MAIASIASTSYVAPVQVNGYTCSDCTDVQLATKGIDPRHPQSGPENRDAITDPTRNVSDPVKIAAAKKAADTKAQETVGYSANGPVGAKVEPGQLVSLIA